jgi:hypothetical protein
MQLRFDRQSCQEKASVFAIWKPLKQKQKTEREREKFTSLFFRWDCLFTNESLRKEGDFPHELIVKDWKRWPGPYFPLTRVSVRCGFCVIQITLQPSNWRYTGYTVTKKLPVLSQRHKNITAASHHHKKQEGPVRKTEASPEGLLF